MTYRIRAGKRSDSALTDRFPVVGEVSEFRIIEVTDARLDELRAILLQETGKAECGMVGEDHFICSFTEAHLYTIETGNPICQHSGFPVYNLLRLMLRAKWISCPDIPR